MLARPTSREHAQRVGLEQIDARLDRKLDLLRQTADQFRQARHAPAVESEERVAKLERAETVTLHSPSQFRDHRFRRTEANRILLNDIGAIVAFQHTSAALLHHARGKHREVIADAESLRFEQRPVRHGERVEIGNLADCHLPLRAGQHLVQLPPELLRFAFYKRDVEPVKRLGQHVRYEPGRQQFAARVLVQRFSHGLAFHRQRHQRRVEYVDIGAARNAVLRIFHRMSQPTKDGSQISKVKRHRTAVSFEQVAYQSAAQSSATWKLADAIAAGEVLGRILFSRVPQDDSHSPAFCCSKPKVQSLRPDADRLRQAVWH